MKAVSVDSDFCLLPYGPSNSTVEFTGEELTVYIYRPLHRQAPDLLILFDGLNRNALSIRDKAIRLSEQTGMIAFAPLMDTLRFPKWRYDRAGIFRHRQIQSREHWTAPLLQALVDWAKDLISNAAPKLLMFGHSAGGQMLSRVCAYSPLSGVERFIITNPSSYVVPVLDERVPYGFKDIFSADDAMEKLQHYLATPITIYLGQEDIGGLNLSRSKGALRQGLHRLERGRFFYQTGRQVAMTHHFEFNWQIVEAPGIAHSSRAMLHADQCSEALNMIFDKEG